MGLNYTLNKFGFREVWGESFVTLLDPLGEPELVCIVTIDHEAEAIVLVHTLD